MKLQRRILRKERELELARASLAQTYDEFRHTLHRRLASRTALIASFGGGLALGLMKRRRSRMQLPKAAREALPKHWFGHYIVWPFLLATARDWVVSRRPTSPPPP